MELKQKIIVVTGGAERDIGPIDLFCSNAGIAAPGGVDTSQERLGADRGVR